ncbi:MAG: M48 family metallopeptidase [Candidatus Pacearchaeota archaeon]|nr:M48 family metallopeptidase [Candidatus Pacearchaeota archaeon]
MQQRLSFEDEITKNKIKSFLLIIIIFAFFVLLGYVISFVFDPSYFFFIMVISIIFSLSYVLVSYYYSHNIAIASVGAKPASPIKHRNFFHAVENMVLASGLPMPKLYVMESNEINAFASGRNPRNAVICITTGALNKLNKQELEGVIAHEMSHIANYDIRFMTLTTVLIGMISIISQIFLRNLWFASRDREERENAIFFLIAIIVAILAPIAAQLVSLAISRKREFSADASAVKFTRYSPGLISALQKIKNEHLSPEQTNKEKITYPKALAPLFISDPFKKKIQNLFSTHPPIEERINVLKKM